MTAQTVHSEAAAVTQPKLTAPPRVRVGRRIAALALACAAAVGAVVATPSPADAWYNATVAGRPGAVAVPQVLAIDSGQYTTHGPYLTLRSNGGPVIYRSPATQGPQDVAAIYSVQQWNGASWVEVTRQSTAPYRIPTGHTWVRLPDLDRSPRTQRGYFRVTWLVAWADATTGIGLGNTNLLPNTVSDFGCATSARPCHSTASWIRIGRVYATGGGW